MNNFKNRIELEEDLLAYSYQHPLISFFHNWGHRQAEKFLDKNKGLVLDLGCGRGDHLKFKQAKKRYIGLDISYQKLKSAISNFDYLAVTAACATNLPFKDKTFDAIISIYNLEHIKEVELALKEINRILKIEGDFIVVLPTESFFFKVGRNLTTKRYAERKYDIDYLKLIKEEHIHPVSSLLYLLKEYFYLEDKKYHPFSAILNFVNISLAIKMRKK